MCDSEGNPNRDYQSKIRISLWLLLVKSFSRTGLFSTHYDDRHALSKFDSALLTLLLLCEGFIPFREMDPSRLQQCKDGSRAQLVGNKIRAKIVKVRTKLIILIGAGDCMVLRSFSF